MVALPEPIPPRINLLPRDERGFPVPWFVQWMQDGKACLPGVGVPDFRVMDAAKFAQVLRGDHRCWICGGVLGTHRVSIIGCMCAVNRVISEPPSHRSCSEWSVRACPFLAHPRARRNEKDLPEHGEQAGIALARNPGVVCLWETKTIKPFRAGAGVLFKLGDPERVDWYCEGRLATRGEVARAMLEGLPTLAAIAMEGGVAEMEAFDHARERVLPLLPPAPQGEMHD
jgi:hypothetical protein